MGPATVDLEPMSGKDRDLSLSVGPGAPGGEYEYSVHIGIYGESIRSSDSIHVIKAD